MTERGTVVSLSGDTAMVKIKRSSACGDNCGSCSGCDNFKIVAAENVINAAVGDSVEISMPSEKVLSAAVIVYVIPIIMLIIGYFIAYAILHTESAGILCGLFGMAVAYIITAAMIRKNKNYCKSTVTKII